MRDALLRTRATSKPLVVLLADARGTEAPDLLIPYAILAESGIVDVLIVSASADRVRLTPGFAWAAPQMTLDQLARHKPEGADLVVVPALDVANDPARSAWLRTQAKLGAHIMSICYGAQVLAGAGLLDGREAATHWYIFERLVRRYPRVSWRRDRRWITDGPVTTTAGISAAEPATLHIVREVGGEAVMRQTAERLGLALPEQHHRGRDFHLTAGAMLLVTLNRLARWRHEKVAVPLSAGLNEIALGSALDGWSRTYRSTAWAIGSPSVISRHGLEVFPDPSVPPRFDREIALAESDAMVKTFQEISRAYGRSTGRFVARQFEHPYGALCQE